MKTIPIGKGQFTKVDDDIYHLLSEYRWYLNRYVHTVFWVKGKPKTGLMHRIITNAPKGKEVDHIDGDKLNNQRSNLRLCSHSQNQRNRRKLNKNNTSGYKGVFWDKSERRWYVQITVNGKAKSIGSGFSSSEEASKRYDKFSSKMHGRFSCTNKMIKTA